MTPEEIIATIKQARELVGEVYRETDIPQIQSMMRHADQNLHWALWNLGEVETLRPDTEI